MVNFGCASTDEVVCGLKWEWEISVPELAVSVFVIPRKGVKGRKSSRFMVCNSIAQSIIEAQRGEHPEYVFTYRGHRVGTMNNSAWQRARRLANLAGLHVHDLRHTVGMRLREAEVREETIADILWHTRQGMTAHYSVAQAIELVTALNLITDQRNRTNRSLSMIARESMEKKLPINSPSKEKAARHICI